MGLDFQGIGKETLRETSEQRKQPQEDSRRAGIRLCDLRFFGASPGQTARHWE
jgi:hypothetical protein